MGSCKYLGFTSPLLKTLTECRGKIDSWVEREKLAADRMEEEYQQTLSQEQSAINSLEEELLAVQFKIGINIKEGDRHRQQGSLSPNNNQGIAQRQRVLLREKERLQAEIVRLNKERDAKSEVVKTLEKEEEREAARAAEVRSKRQMAEESKNTTVDDLTRGIINYKYLGLDFEKAENQKLRFSFTQVDPAEPSRKFSFVLGANDFDVYDVDECNPPVDQGVLIRLLHDLNAEDDLGMFLMKMRTAFVELL